MHVNVVKTSGSSKLCMSYHTYVCIDVCMYICIYVCVCIRTSIHMILDGIYREHILSIDNTFCNTFYIYMVYLRVCTRSLIENTFYL
jgi:hypothetical protein